MIASSAKKVATTPAKKTFAQTPRRDSFAAAPSVLPAIAKDINTAASSSLPQTSVTAHSQSSAQPKPLFSHSTAKPHPIASAPHAAPQTAPRPVSSVSKRTSIAPSAVPKMSGLMTPQAKPKQSTTATFTSTAKAIAARQPTFGASNGFAKASATPKRPIQAKPAASTFAAPSKAQETPKAPAQRVAAPAASSTTVTTSIHTLADSAAARPSKETAKVSSSQVPRSVQTAQSALPRMSPKNKMTEEEMVAITTSLVWNGMMDTIAIKMLERNILHRCVGIVRTFCPRNGDSAEDVLEKYVAGQTLFDGVEKTHKQMLSLISNQSKQFMKAPAKPFKTALYYLYRAMFEEYHEQIPEATTFLEKAISSAAEPRKRVMSSFKSFCIRIRDLTQQQMNARESLAVGVRRMQIEVGLPSGNARDAQALVDLLEEPEFDGEEEDFGLSNQLEDLSLQAGEEAEDEENEFEQVDDSSAVASPISEQEEQWVDATTFMETDITYAAQQKAPVQPKAVTTVPSGRPAPRPTPAVSSLATPSKVKPLSQTPIGKPQRRVVFEEKAEEEKKEVSSFKLVYEASKPSRRTKQALESQTVVTPVRRSNRIDQPLRAGQSSNAMDLLPESNWAYQPNEELFSSGKLVTMSASKSNVRRSGHLVSVESANQKIAQMKEKALSTPSRLGPARRIPVAFDEEADEDEEIARRPTTATDKAQEPEEDVNAIIADLKTMDIPAIETRKTQSKPEQEATLPKIVPVVDAIEEHKESEESEDEESEEEAVKPVSFTPARQSTRKAAQSAKVHLMDLTQTPSHKKGARRQSTLPAVADESAPASAAVTPAPAVLSNEEEEDTSLYVTMRKAALSTTAYGSGYVVSKTPKKASAVIGEEMNGVEDTPSRRSHRIASKKY